MKMHTASQALATIIAGGFAMSAVAAEIDPALAAMLLSKLRGNAMGAAGLGIPDPATRAAWMAATTAQAERAKHWTVNRGAVLTASIVRDIAPRQAGADSPVYRLTL